MPLRSAIRDFLKLEAAGGILLFIAAVLAMIVANTPLSKHYDLLISTPVEIRVGAFELVKPLLLWINDGLMAVFFLMVGLELKREMLVGELSDRAKLSLPALGAVGGMAVPAVIYAVINAGDPVAIRGWAIPAATDIAFALGILSLLGTRVPVALKVFLVSLAIFDDIGAIVVIALFYTNKLSITGLMVAVGSAVVLFVLNRRGVTELTPYGLVGLVMWVAVLKSGVHATLAGVVLAQFIPMRDPADPDRSPLRRLEHDLHTIVAFVILPVFAFANSGISLKGAGLDYLLHPVPLGIAAGLFLGKQVGILAFAWVGVKLGLASLPQGINWRNLYGAALLCGVGFTMSLFIGSLAFEGADTAMLFDERLGIIVGSLVSGVIGYAVLRMVLPQRAANP
jgi:NhaA family Na+:H+ antiporter